MCGIAGLFYDSGIDINIDTLKAISHSLADRGPDDVGFLGWSPTSSVNLTRDPDLLGGSQFCFLHRRLSILDLSPAGWQPMGTPDGRYYITFNGEIYNYLELQAELSNLGHQFSSHSDTEVLITAYAEWGVGAFNKLIGMFAFAIFDSWERNLLLTRDYFGIKPLYYTYFDHGFAFASEIKALLNLPEVKRRIHAQRMYDYLHSGLTDYGDDTLFADIKQLRPSHFLKISVDKLQSPQVEQYWHLEFQDAPNITFSEATEHLRHLFLESVNLHLRSDVPVGAALSGGIDSSAIVMAMRYLQGSQLELHTFSYIASDPVLSEEKWVDTVATAAGAIRHKVKPTPQELLDDLQSLVTLQDEPFGSTSIYAQYRVFQLAKAAGIKVMLDGQGADELLGGYRPYLAARLGSLLRQGKWKSASQFLQRISKQPGNNQQKILLRALTLLLPPSLQVSVRQLLAKDFQPLWLNRDWLAQNQLIPRVYQRKQGLDILREELSVALLESSLPMLLRYEDRNSMVHSIESRVPFLTPALVSFIFSLPEEFIISEDGTSKAIFRSAMRNIVPNSILERKDKIGFATPEQSWLQDLHPWLESVINSEIAEHIPALNVPQMQSEFLSVIQTGSPYGSHIWRWVNLICWAEQFSVIFES